MPFIHHDFDLILSYNIIYMKNEITSQNIFNIYWMFITVQELVCREES